MSDDGQVANGLLRSIDATLEAVRDATVDATVDEKVIERIITIELAVALAQTVFHDLDEVDSLVRIPFDVPCRNALEGVSEALRTIRVAAIAIPKAGATVKRPADQAEEGMRHLEEQIRTFLPAFRAFLLAAATEELQERFAPVIDRYEEQFEARQLVAEVRETRDEAKRVLSDTRQAAGATGEAGLAKHFGDYAHDEQRTADALRTSCIVVLLAIVGLATLLLVDNGADITASHEIAKLAITIPMAVLAAYLGGEATRHRRVARRARELAIQLQTVDAFTRPLPEDLRDQLRTELGRNVFARIDVAVVEGDGSGPSAVGEATVLLEKVADLLKSVAVSRPGA